MEQDWGTLKTAIADYWMNHSWLEDQKFRANNARYREAGHSRDTKQICYQDDGYDSSSI